MSVICKNPIPLPPRLSMDEYVVFVEANARQCDPEKAKRQKELEENIQVMFSFKIHASLTDMDLY